MTITTRAIVEADRAALKRFLDRHTDPTLFLRGNLADAGLRNSGHPFAGDWMGAFEGEELSAVATHFNGGNVVVAGSEGVAAAAGEAVRVSQRPVRGIIGPWAAACAVREALAIEAPLEVESREVLYRMSLERLTVPGMLVRGDVRCRHAQEAELDALAGWRVAFEVESLGRTETRRQRLAALENLTRAHDGGRLFVLDDARGKRVATSAFNAWADDIVQVGGVFTPPDERGKGYGRAVVAGSLLDAGERGARRSVLFTRHDNRPARRAYEALGFEAVGDYGVLLY